VRSRIAATLTALAAAGLPGLNLGRLPARILDGLRLVRLISRCVDFFRVMGTARATTAGRGLGALSADIEARAELMEGFRVCAKCGVDNFTQRPVRGS